MAYQERLISAGDGLKLYVRDYRPTRAMGRTILCLSGLTRNSQDFDHIGAAMFEQGHRVVTMDYRGRGQSEFDENWENYNPATYIGDVFNVCSALGVHDAVFLGTSLGGLLSMAMCAMAPGLVHSVILNDVGPDLNEEGLAKIIAYTSDNASVSDLEGAVEKLKSYYQEEKSFADKDWFNIAKKTYKLKEGRYVPNWDVKIAENLKNDQSKDERKDLWPYFYALGKRRVLVIRGEESNVFTKVTFDKMLDGLEHISGIEINGVGHAPTLEEEMAQAEILRFIQ
ncbi:putative Alpha/beta hydrolase fold protein [Candidatus Terasakiella magnetica]|uniref:Putative Alpha/beta hydrolase fold protein n=1 Tax=Candidatus Terasakiella magnetica TaxID=1867952 RepID=A0A1C3RCW4_9PROT|nr:alpha/beta hydrolase [Candidatus Terasakiella magnetica]SCA55074.1 putative Alpha/beta hydrolase fold protein [Candidatus Terasakiella magnetica]